jgi:hypothetical protein
MWGWYNRPVVAAVPSGLRLTPIIIIIIIILFDHEDIGDMFPRSVCCLSTDYKALYRRRQYSSYVPL